MCTSITNADTPSGIDAWLMPQVWTRLSDIPVISLGEGGSWDDTHLFAPCVAYENGSFRLWYCGSTSSVQNRVFKLGLAESSDGIHFTKSPASPVFAFLDGKRSILTPAFLRHPDGSVCRQNGRLRLWFASTDFSDPESVHTLHETSSGDGVHWSPPSAPELEHVYAPTIMIEGDAYRMWYVDVSAEPWVVRHASSPDGRQWSVDEDPCIVIDQAWETKRLFYPTVRKTGDAYLMWYGSYWSGHPQMTALGFAVSDDGVTWRKHPDNPVFTPDPNHPWESHYTTSQTVLRMPDGSWHIWYATRKAPPHVNKYFAIGTAKWDGPAPATRIEWPQRTDDLRRQIAEIFTLPTQRVPLDAETHRTIDAATYTIEAVTFDSEPSSRVTALLYLPKERRGKLPAAIVACGHGGSKSCLYAQYAGQLYATLGFACLVPDTIGEEERHVDGKMGTRAHDLYQYNDEERLAFVQEKLKRSVLGKIVWDLMCGVDYLQSRPEINGDRIGVMGYSLGGASAGGLAVLDDRVRAAIICGWGFLPSLASHGKHCTRLPYAAFAETMDFGEMTALVAPHAATLFFSGDSDKIIDNVEGGAALVRQVREGIAHAKRILTEAGIDHTIESEFVAGADHRPLFLTPTGVAWMQRHLMPPTERLPIPPKTIKFGDWVDAQGQAIEKLYNTEARERGTEVVDVNAIYRTPKELACFPDRAKPAPEYTFAGWTDAVIKANAEETQE